MADVRAIDAWINAPSAPQQQPGERNVNYLFGERESADRVPTPRELLDRMDEAGIEKGVLTAYDRPEQLDWVCRAVDEFPDRFAGSKVVDPRRGMDAVREIEMVARDHNFRMIRMIGAFTQVPYNAAACYPIYSKCVELDLVVGVNVGIPGPRVPGRCQDPLDIDEVCWFFPELKVVFSHGGEPWEEMCVKLMLKWPNLYYMTSAFAPRYIPQAIVKYLNSRGADKVMWASDFPLLPFERCMQEVANMEFRDDHRKEQFLRGNADRLFFNAGVTAEAGS